MKNMWIALLGLTLTVPAWAQEEPAPEPAPAETAPAAPAPDAAPADQAPAPEAAPAEQAPAPAADATPPPAETPPAEAAPTEAAPAEAAAPKEPWPVYAQVGYARTVISSSGAGNLGTADYNSKFVDLAFGKRLFETVGLEFHYGLDKSDFGTNDLATDHYYGLFLVPTATVFETVELAFPVGYGRGSYSPNNSASTVSKSFAYGFNAQVPLRAFGDTYPDIRFYGGWMIWNQTSAMRVYGPSFGMRYDFTVPNPGNPFAGAGGWFSGIGDWYKEHMPGWLGGGDSKSADAPPAS